MVNLELNKLSKSIIFGEELLRKVVNEKNLETEHIVIISLYRKLLEQLDGNFVLADHELESPAKVMIRAAFETYLSLCYILKEEKRVKDRAYCYYIGYVKSQHDTAIYAIKNPVNGIPKEKLEQNIQKTTDILKMNKFKKIVNEWEKTKIRLDKPFEPKWYSLFRGPTNIKKLVENLKEPLTYKFYQLLSHEAHADQALNGIHGDEHTLSLKPIRNSNGDFQVHLSRSLCTSATLKFISRLFPLYKNEFVNFCKDIDLIP